MKAESPNGVVIIGAGPTGCTLALLLARLGISVAVVERNAAPQQHPAACILNVRTMEIFREIGIEGSIQSCCRDSLERANIAWIVSMAGRELGRIGVLPEDLQGLLTVSPTHAVQCPQHKLEPILWRAMAQQPSVVFYPAHQCAGIAQDDHFVRADLIEAGSGRRLALRGTYLVGCDGAASAVRRELGLAMEGDVLQHMIGIHFFADLSQWVDHRKCILYWILNRDLLGVLIAHGLPTEWVLFLPYFPPQQTASGRLQRQRMPGIGPAGDGRPCARGS